jgi:hypothetical protein
MRWARARDLADDRAAFLAALEYGVSPLVDPSYRKPTHPDDLIEAETDWRDDES